jgi:hypothetical protein
MIEPEESMCLPYSDVKERCTYLPLTRGKVTIIDAADFERVGKLRWGCVSGYAKRGRYLGRKNGRHATTTLSLHRVLLDAPPGFDVDHINRIPWDNRRRNLRLVARRQNCLNAGLKAASNGAERLSRFKGVTKNKKSWIVRIASAGGRITVGRTTNETEAARIYDAAAKRHYGEFACTNVSLGLLPPP